MADELFRRIDKQNAQRIETVANIASGHGELGLANQLWAFAERLRQRAQGENLNDDKG